MNIYLGTCSVERGGDPHGGIRGEDPSPHFHNFKINIFEFCLRAVIEQYFGHLFTNLQENPPIVSIVKKIAKIIFYLRPKNTLFAEKFLSREF